MKLYSTAAGPGPLANGDGALTVGTGSAPNSEVPWVVLQWVPPK